MSEHAGFSLPSFGRQWCAGGACGYAAKPYSPVERSSPQTFHQIFIIRCLQVFLCASMCVCVSLSLSSSLSSSVSIFIVVYSVFCFFVFVSLFFGAGCVLIPESVAWAPGQRTGTGQTSNLVSSDHGVQLQLLFVTATVLLHGFLEHNSFSWVCLEDSLRPSR